LIKANDSIRDKVTKFIAFVGNVFTRIKADLRFLICSSFQKNKIFTLGKRGKGQCKKQKKNGEAFHSTK
jgi:hypothetical protein